MSEDIFWWSFGVGVGCCHRHLVDEVRDTAYNTQDSPIAKNYPIPNVSSAQVGGTEAYQHIFRNGQCHGEDDLTLGLTVHPSLVKALEPWF